MWSPEYDIQLRDESESEIDYSSIKVDSTVEDTQTVTNWCEFILLMLMFPFGN